MANSLKIILGELGSTNYQPRIYVLPEDPETEEALPTRFVSWCWISADEIIEPGIYVLPEEQRSNLEWFYDNKFRLDAFGRLHLQYCMTDYLPTQITVM